MTDLCSQMESVAQAGLEPASSCFSLLRAGITIQLPSPGSVITLLRCVKHKHSVLLIKYWNREFMRPQNCRSFLRVFIPTPYNIPVKDAMTSFRRLQREKMLPSPGSLIDTGEGFLVFSLKLLTMWKCWTTSASVSRHKRHKIVWGNVSFQSMISTCQSRSK